VNYSLPITPYTYKEMLSIQSLRPLMLLLWSPNKKWLVLRRELKSLKIHFLMCAVVGVQYELAKV
jgi:hypothetical protein